MLILACNTVFMAAQTFPQEEKTVLFLIPFYGDVYDEQLTIQVENCDDIDKIPSFKLMGFWNGAQIALSEFDTLRYPLRIIVKDISDNDTKLRALMENKDFMRNVDLIIGPFFSKQFMMAAQYAEKYKIPIVNPFTNRTDILTDNEFVYKLMPSNETRPLIISHIADRYPSRQILIWTDTTLKTKDPLIFINYFELHQIPYKVIHYDENIINMLKPETQNIILPFCEDDAKIMTLSQQLYTTADLEHLTLIVPESWLKSPLYDVEYYSKLNLHFFSAYHIDYEDEETVVFIDKYKHRFQAPPSLDNFAYQGYDITRFFINLLFNNMDLDRVKTSPIAYSFTLEKIPRGGYENTNIHFMEVKDNEIIPVKW